MTNDIQHNICAVIKNGNFVPEITPYLKEFTKFTKENKDKVEVKHDQRKKYTTADELGYCFVQDTRFRFRLT